MNLQTTYPSIGYMIEGVGNMEPATTVWELWDSDKEGPGMNSRNHIMFGSNGAWFYKAILGIVPSPANETIGYKTGYDHLTAGPDVSIVNFFGGKSATAAGRTNTPHGDVNVNWAILEPRLTCQSSSEQESVTFMCTEGVISSVKYSFYGTPTGDCVHGYKGGTCNATNAFKIVHDTCVGKSSCSFTPSNDLFGDPCTGTVKTYAGDITCSVPAPSVTSYSLTVEIPIGSIADIKIPIVPSLRQTAQNIVISEGTGATKTIMWTGGMYIPGIAGITGATFNRMRTAVIVQVMSGKYSFSSFAKLGK